jgi:hypothetical protein
MFAGKVVTGNPYYREKFSTVDLPIKIDSYVKKKKIYFFYEKQLI